MKAAKGPVARAGESSHGDPKGDLAGALHEVSNALTVVLGWLDAARSQLPPGDTRDALEVARTHARLGHSISRRAIGAEIDETNATRSALSIATDAALGITHEANRRAVGVRVDDGDGTDLLVRSAPAALQILINLLLNAIDFSPRSSEIVLSVQADGPHMVFGVRDHGPGIPSDRLETLFSSPDSTRSGGAGIGLRHSYALAIAKGGELQLRETGPEGSTFELRWPIGDAPSGTLHRSVPPPSLDTMRLVVLEDDPAVLSLVEFGLTGRGANVVTATNMDELSLLIANGVFDAALLDLSPIQGDPTAALERVLDKSPDLPIVIISGSAAPELDTSRVAAWVRKPFEISELVDVLTRVGRE